MAAGCCSEAVRVITAAEAGALGRHGMAEVHRRH
jgi:hypothetical protein